MNREKRDAILIRLTEALHEKGSWCGETHVQKAVYFLQEMVGVDLGFDFILYKHGPFSFDLRDELMTMRAEGMVTFQVKHDQYGPSILPESSAESLKKRFPNTLRNHEPRIIFVANKFESKPVTELERIGTAFYVVRDLGGTVDIAKCARRVNEIKPHIPIDEASEAVRTVQVWQKEANKFAVNK